MAKGLELHIPEKIRRDFVLKAFEQYQWELFDAPAKEVAIKFWIDLGYECVENPYDYGIDLLEKGKEFSCEVEVKLGRHGPTFIFPNLHVGTREKKFMISPAMFMIMNNSLTHGAVVNRKLILASPVVEVKNTTVLTEERFYDIPAENIAVINLPSKKCVIKTENTMLSVTFSHIVIHNN